MSAKLALVAGVLLVVLGPAAPAAAIPPPRPQVSADFNGDGRADLAVWDPGTGMWRLASVCDLSPDTGCGFSHGHLTDTSLAAMAAPGDYDGDGTGDPAVFDRDTGLWHIAPLKAPARHEYFGVAGDIAVPADYDADGITDVAVFRPSDATWHVGAVTIQLGKWGDRPVPADYDGDGSADPAVFSPNGVWSVRYSGTGTTTAIAWGKRGDLPVPADYDGDGRADLAVYRPGTGVWQISQGSGQPPLTVQWGVPGDLPVPADYDGDNRADIAIYRPLSTSLIAPHPGWLIYGAELPIAFGNPSERPVSPTLTTDVAQ